MSFVIAPRTHWCRIGDAFIFLDLERDRYFMLAPACAARFAELLQQEPDESSRQWLEARGLTNLTPPLGPLDSQPAIRAPLTSIIDDPALIRASLASTFRAVIALLRARRDVQSKPLNRILSGLPSAPSEPAVQPMQAVCDAAAAFLRARHYISGIDQCLSRGIAMRRMLAGRGCAAKLVIGVTLPFSAHCWVQYGPTVLTDSLDLVTPFTPILSV